MKLTEKTLWEKVKFWFGACLHYVTESIWWLKYRIIPKHRYHVLPLGTKPGYSDVRERLLHANFQLLKIFIEKEQPFEYINWDATPEHAHAAKEMKELYDWWLNVRPKRQELDPINHVDVPPSEFVPIVLENGETAYEYKRAGTQEENEAWDAACKESNRLEQLWDEEDNTNLKRLADIRLYLWT